MSEVSWPECRYPLVALQRLVAIQLGKMLQPRAKDVTDQLTPYLGAGSLSEMVNATELPKMYASLRERAVYEVLEGDLLVAEGGDVGRTVFTPHLAEGTIIQNSLHRLRPACGDLRYTQYALEAVYLSGWLDVLCNRATFAHLTSEKLRSLRVPNPNPVTQRVIADYLDAETARIDALIRKKRQMVVLLGETRSSRLHELLVSAEPESRTLLLGQVLDRIIDYRGATPLKVDDGVPLLTASNIVDGHIDLTASRQFIPDRLYDAWMRRGLPRMGDLLLTTEAPLGEVALIEDPSVALAQRIMLLRPRADIATPEYLLLYLRSARGRAELSSRASGSTVMGVRTDRLRQVPVQVPRLDVQANVVAAMTGVDQEVRHLSDLLTRQGVCLMDHRHALITAAVTGQLPIPGVAA